jgi:hypothetical protein
LLPFGSQNFTAWFDQPSGILPFASRPQTGHREGEPYAAAQKTAIGLVIFHKAAANHIVDGH